MNSIKNYTTEDEQFYPTPKSFLEKIYQDFHEQLIIFYREDKYDIKVLEPSAGKGDIALFLRDKGSDHWERFPRCDIECIEIDKTLQATLKGLDFPVVYNDFLSYETYTKYDLVFMNPPFATADKHFLKAISLQKKYGGRILCILNAETLRNPYTRTRKELVEFLEKNNAIIKFYESPFASDDTERSTDVDVAVVWVDVPAPESVFLSRIFEELDEAKKIDFETHESTEQTELIKMGMDWITAFVRQYKEHIDAAFNFLQEYENFRNVYNTRFANVESETSKYTPSFSLEFYGKEIKDINVILEIIRRHYWSALFANPKFSGRLTQKLKDELYSRLDVFSHFDFTEHNILVLMEENMNATIKGIEDEILSLFDKLTSYAQYDGCENVHYYNGWKTNSAHKLNRKIIIPFYGVWKQETRYKYHGDRLYGYCTRNGYEYKLDEYEAYKTLSDMSKTLNYLANGVCDLQNMNSLSAIIRRNFDAGNAKNIYTEFFTLTFYKKGTCHLIFNNEDLLEKFNLFASQRKGWLPPFYGKKDYATMNAEEKNIVKEFSGTEENYNKIFKNQSVFLVEESSQFLRLTD